MQDKWIMLEGFSNYLEIPEASRINEEEELLEGEVELVYNIIGARSTKTQEMYLCLRTERSGQKKFLILKINRGVIVR